MRIFEAFMSVCMITLGLITLYTAKKRKQDKNVYKICKLVEERRLKDKEFYIKTASKYQIIQGVIMLIYGVEIIIGNLYFNGNEVKEILEPFLGLSMMIIMFVYLYKVGIRVDKFYI